MKTRTWKDEHQDLNGWRSYRASHAPLQTLRPHALALLATCLVPIGCFSTLLSPENTPSNPRRTDSKHHTPFVETRHACTQYPEITCPEIRSFADSLRNILRPCRVTSQSIDNRMRCRRLWLRRYVDPIRRAGLGRVAWRRCCRGELFTWFKGPSPKIVLCAAAAGFVCSAALATAFDRLRRTHIAISLHNRG